MNNENKIRPKSQAVCDSQIDYTSKWMMNFIKKNHETLTTKGIQPQKIIDEYTPTTKFPIGKKAFFQMLHMYGLEKIGNGQNGYVYIINEEIKFLHITVTQPHVAHSQGVCPTGDASKILQ